MKRTTFVIFALAAFGAAQAVTLHDPDTFEDGQLAGWGGGSNPTNVTGGAAFGTHYLQISSEEFNLASYNQAAKWSGDYTGAAGVSAWFNNTGPNSVEMRLVLFSGNSNRFVSNDSIVLAPRSGWVEHTFVLGSSNFTSFASISYGSMITSVNRIMFRHDVGAPSSNGTAVTGTVGLDNIQAVPEPMSMAALGLGALALIRRRRA